MGYVEQNLNAGERILYKTGLHSIVLLAPWLSGGLVIIFGISLMIGAVAAKDGAIAGVALFMIGIGGGIIALGIWSRNATEMAVTSKRIIIKTGLIHKRTLELFLSKVESVGVEQGLLGRMLNYGSIVVRGTGGTAEPFRKIRSPLEFRRQVQQQSEAPATM